MLIICKKCIYGTNSSGFLVILQVSSLKIHAPEPVDLWTNFLATAWQPLPCRLSKIFPAQKMDSEDLNKNIT